MDIKSAVFYGTKKLQNLDNPKFEAEVLCARVLNKDRAFLKTYPEKNLSLIKSLKFRRFVSMRSKNIPIAQIFGEKEWCGMNILVNKNVLIPRDETEILCHTILKEEGKPQHILDLGTGSGNIAIFMKKNFSNAEVTAIDISKKALEVAKKNTQLNNVEVNFIKSDLLEKVNNAASFDLIVANLPYVPKNLKVAADLSFEPQNAIFSGLDGLDAIRKFAKELVSKKIKFKKIWLEFLPTQKKEITKIFKDKKVEFFGDSGGDIFFAKIK
ncbi:MAG: peptide chain release factor N(5)-glutamine methyltransferase [Candidatus Peregrinibacteria bacterium]|nr:peptide chain release factor N(5)-glutamine methyltransferase [Candidatus Peregrinibacteria bacterium]